MAACHVRSISLPSRSHPLTLNIEEQLLNLKASQSSSVCQKIAGIKDLYECVDGFLQLPLTQQNLSNDCRSESVEEILNGSLRVLDICSTTRDIFSQAKEGLKNLESSLRRRRAKESGLTSEVDAYMAARKKMSKEIRKCLKNMNRKDKNQTSSMEADNILRSVEEISIAVFEALLSFISQPKSKPSSRSIVSKLIKSKRVTCESDANVSQAEKIDADLLFLKSSNECDLAQVQNVVQGLEAFESSIQELEEELECVYRRMVKARVSLLNIINHYWILLIPPSTIFVA